MAQRYDTAFKLTLQHVDVAMQELVGSAITNWMNIEFPQTRIPRADLLGETKAGELVHFDQRGGAFFNVLRLLDEKFKKIIFARHKPLQKSWHVV